MRGRRTAAVLLLLTALTTGCRDDQDIGPPEPTAAPTLEATIETLRAPQLDGDLEVRVVTGVPVREGGFVVVLDGLSGSALQAVAPIDVEGGRITGRDLRKPEARRLVDAYVTADTVR